MALADDTLSTEVYIRIWLETNPTDNKYFAGYVGLGAGGLLIPLVMLWCAFLALTLRRTSNPRRLLNGFRIYYLTMMPENGIRLHTKLVDAVMRYVHIACIIH